MKGHRADADGALEVSVLVVRAAIAAAMRVSVDKGRCSPCCSKLPAGTTATSAARAASSWEVAVEMNTPSILCDRSQCLGQLRHAKRVLERLQLLRSQSQHVNHTSKRRNLDTLHSVLRGDTGLLDLPKLAPGNSQPGQTQRLVTHQFRWPGLQRPGTRRGDRTGLPTASRHNAASIWT